MHTWHNIEGTMMKGGMLKKVRRRSHTVTQSQFKVDMHDEASSVREKLGKRIDHDELFGRKGCCGKCECIIL